ncbi:MAG: guanylate kinase [Desulfuromonadales bacterium]|nr:guanylate kinase [Desulfuromonadales bacterium]
MLSEAWDAGRGTRDAKRKGLLYIVSAPSGAGKTSICSEILSLFPGLRQSISYTTRSMRSGEQDGKDYHFVSCDEFDRMVADGAFAEWAEVHGNCYGTSKAILEQAMNAGVDVLLDIDFQGAAQLRESGVDGVFVFILPPSMSELRKRLEGRNTDSRAVIEQRMTNAVEELAQAEQFDYLVVNDVFEQAVDKVRAIMIAESIRTSRLLDVLSGEFSLK